MRILIIFAVVFCAFAGTNFALAASPERAKIEEAQIREFLSKIPSNRHLALIEVPNMNCKMHEKMLNSCINDFTEVTRRQISLENRLVALELKHLERLFTLLMCLNDEGYETKLINVR